MFIKCKVLNHIILAKEKHGRENSKSSLFLTVIKCRYLLQNIFDYNTNYYEK